MVRLTLYDQATPPRVLGSRMARDGVIRLGRDASADWIIADAERLISRHHLDLRFDGQAMWLRALGANGVYVGDPSVRAPENEEIKLAAGDAIRFGPYELKIGADEPHGVASAPENAESLLDAFCEGAQLDPSQFLAEDPASLMREAGAIYREMVVGLNAVLKERNAARGEAGLDRTTLDARDNNLLKWAPVQRIAVDLLCKSEATFLAGAESVRLSFDDVRKHLAGILGGHRSAVRAVLDRLDPERLLPTARPGLFRDRYASAWQRLTDTHRELVDAWSNDIGLVTPEFGEGYEQAVRQTPEAGS